MDASLVNAMVMFLGYVVGADARGWRAEEPDYCGSDVVIVMTADGCAAGLKFTKLCASPLINGSFKNRW